MSRQYFDAFAWAVPDAFSDAVNYCHFEEGDILYSHPAVYEEPWATAKKEHFSALQVTFPPRSGVTKSGAGAVFDKNWSSEVRVDLYYGSELSKTITTNQGNLYTALWRNDLCILESAACPPIPLRLNHVLSRLKEPTNNFLNMTNGKTTFVLPRDTANPVSKAKFQKIHSVLIPHLQSTGPTIMSPEEAGLDKSAQIAPTIEVVLFIVDRLTKDELFDLVKSAVYKPSPKAKKSNFRLASHGLIID